MEIKWKEKQEPESSWTQESEDGKFELDFSTNRFERYRLWSKDLHIGGYGDTPEDAQNDLKKRIKDLSDACVEVLGYMNK